MVGPTAPPLNERNGNQMNSEDRNHINIDPERCKGCGTCVMACPRDCITLGSQINTMGYQYARFEQNDCLACGLCFYSCPEFGAIAVYKGTVKPKSNRPVPVKKEATS